MQALRLHAGRARRRHAGPDAHGPTVPLGLGGNRWRVVTDTAVPTADDELVCSSDDWKVGAWSLVLLERDEILPV